MFKVVQMENRTLSWWYDQQEDIDFDPIYQRKGGIWRDRDQQLLIDSILNGFDIPKFYVADFTYIDTRLNTSKKKYAVIDGKQRFEAMFAFLSNQIVLAKNFEFLDDISLKLQGLSFKDLANNFPKIARRVENYNLTVMSVITDDAAKINQLFVRLNTNSPLRGGEKRNAMAGLAPDLIRNVASHAFFREAVRFSTQRGQDKDTAAKMLLVEHRGDFVDTKKAQIDKMVFVAAGEAEVHLKESANRVINVLDEMQKIFSPKDPLLKSEGVAVPYYWLVRETERDRHSKIRPFLVNFTHQVDAARKSSSGEIDRELLDYYTMSRTSNDAASMRGRYLTLRRRFDKEQPPQH